MLGLQDLSGVSPSHENKPPFSVIKIRKTDLPNEIKITTIYGDSILLLISNPHLTPAIVSFVLRQTLYFTSYAYWHAGRWARFLQRTLDVLHFYQQKQFWKGFSFIYRNLRFSFCVYVIYARNTASFRQNVVISFLHEDCLRKIKIVLGYSAFYLGKIDASCCNLSSYISHQGLNLSAQDEECNFSNRVCHRLNLQRLTVINQLMAHFWKDYRSNTRKMF